MKKAKVMLTAIALFGVIGAALAFKAKFIEGKLYTCNAATAVSTCDLKYNAVNFKDDGERFDVATITQANLQNLACTDRCDIITTVEVED